MEEQFTVLGDQIRALTTQFSTWVVTMGMDLETLLQSAERTDVSTMRKLMPINGEMDSNSIFWNSKGIYNPKNFWIGCWLLKRFLNSTGCPMNDESLWWYTHSGRRVAAWWQQLKQSRVRQGQLKINSWEKLLKKM
jgi:hypothetical protein